MADDEFIDLLKHQEMPEARDDDPYPDADRRGSAAAFLMIVILMIPIGILFEKFGGHPAGLTIVMMVTYTLAIPYIASNQFLRFVPWERNLEGRFLLRHCLALVVVYGIVTGALAVKPRLPDLFTMEGRKGSLFDVGLMLILLVLALWGCSWGSRPEGERLSDRDAN